MKICKISFKNIFKSFKMSLRMIILMNCKILFNSKINFLQ